MKEQDFLLEESFLRKIDRLSLVVRRRRTGQLKGERRSTKRGSSVEFADYRDYAKGDDLRRVDWNIYARLERLFLKLFEEEEEHTFHLLLDASGSMDWGNKWIYARRVAAALGYIALCSGDRLTVALMRDRASAAAPRFGPARGRGNAIRLLTFLDGLEATGKTDLNRTLRDYALSARRPGLALLISDLFSPEGYRDGMSALLARGYEVVLLHLLSPDEADPQIAGDLKLVDVESGEEQEVTIDAGMRAIYRRRLADWQEENRRWCAQRDVAYVPVTTDLAFDELILFHLRKQGVVR